MKVVITAECLRIQVTKQGSNATFVVEKEKQPAPVPGQPRQIAAKQVINVNFEDDKAKEFSIGKPAKITIEQ